LQFQLARCFKGYPDADKGDIQVANERHNIISNLPQGDRFLELGITLG